MGGRKKWQSILDKWKWPVFSTTTKAWCQLNFRLESSVYVDFIMEIS